MVGSGPHQVESMGSQHQDDFLNLEHRRDWEVSVHTTHTRRSHSQGGGHVSQEQNAMTIQLEINQLKEKLCHAWRRRTPSNSDVFSDDKGDVSYKRRSRIPPNESFSYDEEHHHERRYKSPFRKGLGSDAMSTALNQISRSPFTQNIEGARLPQRFNQPTFTIYNGRMDPVEHINHFN